MTKLRFNSSVIPNVLQSKQVAFTLLEVMIVVAIVAMLAMIALPSQTGRFNQQKIVETLELVDRYKSNIESVYQLTGEFPLNNVEAGIPTANNIIGNYLEAMQVENGVMQLILGNKLSQLQGKIITVQPVFVSGSLNSPISWICGFDQIPDGMTVAGVNRTNIEKSDLPGRCR